MQYEKIRVAEQANFLLAPHVSHLVCVAHLCSLNSWRSVRTPACEEKNKIHSSCNRSMGEKMKLDKLEKKQQRLFFSAACGLLGQTGQTEFPFRVSLDALFFGEKISVS